MNKFTCPYCHEQFWQPAGASQRQPATPWTPTTKRTFSIGADVPDVVSYERTAPGQTPNKWHVVGPFVRAVGFSCAAVCLFVPVAIWQHWPIWTLGVPMLTGAAYGWFVSVNLFNSLLRVNESYQAAEEPNTDRAPVRRVKLEIDESGQHEVRQTLPLDEATLSTIARAVQNGRAFTVGSMTGRGKPLTRSQFDTLRDWLIRSDYLRWLEPTNRQRGTEFTSKGNALLRALAS